MSDSGAVNEREEPAPLPCPFCGSTDLEIIQSHRPAVRCNDQSCIAHFDGNRWVWIDLWNARNFDVRVQDVLASKSSAGRSPAEVPPAIEARGAIRRRS